MFYAIAHHGTAGMRFSHGYAEVCEGDPPRNDQTTTVWGPYPTRKEAQQAVDEMNDEMAAYADRQAHA